MLILSVASVSPAVMAQTAIAETPDEENQSSAPGDGTAGQFQTPGPAVVPPPPRPRAERGPIEDFPRDPTVPSPEILERMQPRQGEIVGAAPARHVISPLPELPDIQLRAIVLTSGTSGTAMLVAGDRQVSVRLGPSQQRAPLRFPPRQFWRYREQLAQIDELIEADTDGTQLPAPGPSPQLFDLEGFSINGTFFSVEAYSDRAVLLRAYPHDQFVLVH